MRRMLPTTGLIFIALVASLLEGPCSGQDTTPLEEMYAWNAIDYAWATPEDRTKAIESGKYIPENNALIGVKIWKDSVYVNVARWLPGVPSTLNSLPLPVDELPRSTPLIPFPSWEMQQEGNCSAIQYIQGMEIDNQGRMWALDVGRRYFFTSDPDNSCPPKLLLLDLNSGGSIIRTFTFPEDVVSYNDSFLNDLVVHEGLGTDWYAYISDANGTSGAIVVYSLEQNKAWRVEDEKTMKAEEGEASTAIVGGRSTKLAANIDGIALTPKDDPQAQVFYAPLGSFNLYSIPVSVLQNPPTDPKEISSSIIDWGKRTSQGDGMMMDSFGELYFGLLAEDGFGKFPVDARRSGIRNGTVQTVVVFKDAVRLQWVDGFGFNNYNRALWVVSNRLQNIQAKDVNLNETNYRLLRTITGTQSYQYNRYNNNPV